MDGSGIEGISENFYGTKGILKFFVVLTENYEIFCGNEGNH
jgi:hypothetical protein